MRPVRGVVWGCALAVLTAGAEPCRAAWDNVFQVCCATCGGQASTGYAPATSYAAPDPCCNPCPPPQQVCTTRYVQRTYYQPVVCYQTRTYYEPITTYRTSYYCEPVVSYRCSCYVDPCTGCPHQVCCPVTSYVQRAQCCPVQSWVQRCCQVPVTTYQQSCYWEPVTTCCQVPSPCCPNGSPPAAAVQAPPGAVPAPVTPQVPLAPGVNEQRTVPVPGVGESRDTGTSNRPYSALRVSPPQNAAPSPGANRQVVPQTPAPPLAPAAAPPKVRLDRIVLGSGPSVEGEVVRGDRAPAAGAEVMFVNAERRGDQQSVTADSRGQFHVTLATGGWLVYVRGADGTPVFKSRIDVRDEETKKMTLVNR
jgi:hypothetical protein